MDMCTKTKI